MGNTYAPDIRAEGVDNIEVWPAVVYSSPDVVMSEDYVAYNMIGLIAAAGLKANHAPEISARMLSARIDSLEIDPKAARDVLLFRLAESIDTIVVHERVKAEVETRGIQNVRFVDPVDDLS